MPSTRGRGPDIAGALALALLFVPPARASLDIQHGGPRLTDGGFEMRVTNAGMVGNAFVSSGLSFDSSFEFPSHSGKECLNFAAFWVGARGDRAQEPRVSGGPILEWRPTLDRSDTVRSFHALEGGRQRLFDDDRDGRVDEERGDGRDDDADGQVDEDLGIDADQVLTAAYTDTEAAAVHWVYANGETHHPLGVSVRQTARSWSAPTLAGIAGLTFEVVNVGPSALHDVYLGLLADLDSRRTDDRQGHTNDGISSRTVAVSFDRGNSTVTVGGNAYVVRCTERLAAEVSVARDGRLDSGLPCVGVMGLGHTIDPLAGIPEAESYMWAPREESFVHTILLPRAATSSGGSPIIDSERYAALRGDWPGAETTRLGDFSVLISCGPFRRLDPGVPVSVDLALIAGATVDSVILSAKRILAAYHGTTVNLEPDSMPASQRDQYLSGATGTFGHESCVEPPEGITFVADPHCVRDLGLDLEPPRARYGHGQCIWTNADCSLCTGVGGRETRLHWVNPTRMVPPSRQRVVAGDRTAKVLWSNEPEVLAETGQLAEGVEKVSGYRVYRLSDWRGRVGDFPPEERWALLAAFSTAAEDTFDGQRPLDEIVDTATPVADVLHERLVYDVGRYGFVDTTVFNGFDFGYYVSTVVQLRTPPPRPPIRVEGPILPVSGDVVRPRAAARTGRVWVVPNPYRGRSDWDRPPVPSEPHTSHVDFMGLPPVRCVIRIWTLAGDLVAEVAHDGTTGAGQAPWNLVSRNGQDVASGIYLFTVESTAGSFTGRFVIVR